MPAPTNTDEAPDLIPIIAKELSTDGDVVYGVLSPITGQVRYVGSTIDHPRVRLCRAISQVRCGHAGGSPYERWLSTLIHASMEDRLKAVPLDFSTEEEAVDFYGIENLLNEKAGASGPSPLARTWAEEEDALLGTMPDAALAERLGIDPHTVRRRRWRLGIDSYYGPHGRRFTADEVYEIRQRCARERSTTHRVLADEYGVSRSTVSELVRGDTYGRVPFPPDPSAGQMRAAA